MYHSGAVSNNFETGHSSSLHDVWVLREDVENTKDFHGAKTVTNSLQPWSTESRFLSCRYLTHSLFIGMNDMGEPL